MNYFVWNKPLDFDRGYQVGFQYTGRGICLKETETTGTFFSRVVDSREKETCWHRMTYQPLSAQTKIKISFYAYEVKTIWLLQDGQKMEVEIEEILKSSRTINEKKQLLQPFLQKNCEDTADVLLHEVQGRYLWFCLEVFGEQKGQGGIENLFCYFPKETWMEYLPEVYQKNNASRTFLEKYLSVFQSVYDDFDRKLEQTVHTLDSASVNHAGLIWLASWLHLKNLHLWNQEQLLVLVDRSYLFYRKRGTRRALLELMELFVGEMPFMVEEWQTRPYRETGEKKAYLKQLYGENENIFYLLLKEEHLASKQQKDVLQRLIEAVAPAHMEAKLIPLSPRILLGGYVYLGINSVLNNYEPMHLDGRSMLSFSTIGKNRKEGETDVCSN